VLALVVCGWPWHAGEAAVQVEITGVSDEIEDNIRATLDIVRHAEREDLSEGAIRRLHARGRRQIRDAMRPFGYYQPRIDHSFEQRNGRWLSSFRIDPGEPVVVVEVDVRILGEGADEPRFREVLADRQVQEGRRLRHDEYDRLRNAMQTTAESLGYIEAQFTKRRLEVDPASLTARVVLHLQTGPRYYFGKIEVDQDILNEGFIQRIVLIEEGAPYSTHDLLQAQYRLTDSLYFSSVIVETGMADTAERTVPVRIETTPTARQRIRAGVGYATDTRLRGSLGVDWRRLNKAGHSASTELRLSETLSDLTGRYLIPMGDPLEERLLVRLGLTQEDLGDLESRRATLGVSHVTMRGGEWQRTLFTDILHEQTRTPDAPTFTDTLVVPGIGMEKLVADDILFPTRGFRVRGEVRGSQEMLGATGDFVRLEIEANQVTSIGDHWRFFVRSRLGVGLVDDVDTLPASQRFFAGGDLSVRGYSFNSLGPTDEAGNVVGGRHLMFGSVEVERRVWGRLALATFVDAGNAVNSFDDGVEVSAGLGVNVRTPIGTVRIGAARSITESRGLRFHLSIRPDL
jgi:translocation and assembly module TamA